MIVRASVRTPIVRVSAHLPRPRCSFCTLSTGDATAAPAPAVDKARESARKGADVSAKFGDPTYWEGQYSSKEDFESFEWFLPYQGGLREHLLPFVRPLPSSPRILHVGCGTSEVGPELAKERGLSARITDMDISLSAVRLMKRRHAGVTRYTCQEADVLRLTFADGSYDAAIDKGTMDALLYRNVRDAERMANEMHRILSSGGVFLQVTTEHPETRVELLKDSAIGKHEPWSRLIFKEIGKWAETSYFLYVSVK